MITNITEFLDNTARRFPDKTAFTEGERSLSFARMRENAIAAASVIYSKHPAAGRPVAVIMGKNIFTPAVYMGVLYTGACYVPLDPELGAARVKAVLSKTETALIVADKDSFEFTQSLNTGAEIIVFSPDTAFSPDFVPAPATRDTDIAYIVHTSGSTGEPKCVAATHRNLISYLEHFPALIGIDETSVLGNQMPLYVDAVMKDIGSVIAAGSTCVLIPKKLFTTPVRLIEFMNAQNVNTICWTASAMSIVSGWGTLDKAVPRLKTAAFGSERMAVSQLSIWRRALPEAVFFNLYGPTECTGVSAYYKISPETEIDDYIPIGKSFPNVKVFIHDGEIYIGGANVTAGYYNDPEKTRAAFIQNPLNNHTSEIVYKTGDLGKADGGGNLVYLARRDSQIKHMGYRIELGEIETAAGSIGGVAAACAVYDTAITLYYTGQIESREMKAELAALLPRYELPQKIIKLDSMPLTPSGKADRLALKNYSENNAGE